MIQQNLSSLGDQGHKKDHSAGNKEKLKRNLLKIVIPNCLAGIIIVITVMLSMIWGYQHDFYHVILYCMSCYSVMNPVIYTFCNTTFKRDIKWLFGVMVAWWYNCLG